MVGFAHLWKADKLSDVDVAIRLDGSADDILAIPAHQAILSSSTYFWAQVERWTADGAEAPAVGAGRRVKRARVSNRSSPVDPDPPKRPRLQLVLNSHEAVSAADQAAAAESVLAAMYDPTGISNLAALDKLTDTQLLQAAIIADMVQLEDTSAQAAGLLAKSMELSTAVKQQYMSLPAWPQQLLPLFPVMAAGHPLLEVVSSWVRNCASAAHGTPLQGPSLELSKLLQFPLALEMQAVLVQQLGELDRVWADAQLSQLLLQLPLPALVLLLSSTEIKVSSEDNVLYTVWAWLDQQPAEKQLAAAQCLAPCMRCLQLSMLWLSALVMAGDTPEQAALYLVQQQFSPSIKRYLSLRLLGELTPGKVGDYAPELKQDCPSWFLQPRQYTPLPGGHVELQWSLPVSELREACIQAHAEGNTRTLSSGASTPPLKGVCWHLVVCCNVHDSGVTVGVNMAPTSVPDFVYCQPRYSISGGTVDRTGQAWPVEIGESVGWTDFFGLNSMAGGWDAAAWANRGLPTDGDLLLKLQVHDVRP